MLQQAYNREAQDLPEEVLLKLSMEVPRNLDESNQYEIWGGVKRFR
jgi:hypothetical protein